MWNQPDKPGSANVVPNGHVAAVGRKSNSFHPAQVEVLDREVSKYRERWKVHLFRGLDN
jgi:hypothetical protein